MNQLCRIPLEDFSPEEFLSKLSPVSHLAFLSGKDLLYSKYDFLLAIGAHEIRNDLDVSFDEGQWWFGHVNYDAHKDWTALPTIHQAYINFPPVQFFRPQYLIFGQNGKCFLDCFEHEKEQALLWFAEVQSNDLPAVSSNKPSFVLQPTDTREHYINTVGKLKDHLQRGDIYEVNYCRFFEGFAQLDIRDYLRWNTKTATPFSAYYRCGDTQLFCASPERFLCKRGSQVIAQPIKGTAPRSADKEKDEIAKQELFNSEKERAENVMIVDLMRNDLSRIAEKNSVEVAELFGIYSFPQVHQMISTVVAEMRKNCTLRELFTHTFPMGSMTGAPKRRAMELIDRYETRSRELFSGSIGYIDPDGDFDFNVVIRSLMHTISSGKIKAGVGSAITLLADAEAEYEEIDWKLSTILSMNDL